MGAGIYFGPRGNMKLIPAPITGPDMGAKGYTASTLGLNGGASMRTSRASHREYNYSWASEARDDLQPLIDAHMGILGDPPFYFIDPFSADRNVLPPWFAAPMLAGLGGPVLDGRETLPTLSATPANTLGYPVKSATFVVSASDKPIKVYVPIPPLSVLWLGFHGSVVSGTPNFTVTPFTSATAAAAPVNLAPLAVTSTTLMNASFAGSSYVGVEIALSGAGSMLASGLIGQILKVGAVPPTGSFISGRGHSGCKMEDSPSVSGISSKLDLIGATVKLVEVGGWL